MTRGNLTSKTNFSRGNESFLPPANQFQGKVEIFRVLFGNIAFFSFLGNVFLCVAIYRRRQLLRRTYNILVLNLAVTDMFTGLLHLL